MPTSDARLSATLLTGFLGTGLDRDTFTAVPDACLVGEAAPRRFDPAAFRHLPGPFPVWQRGAA